MSWNCPRTIVVFGFLVVGLFAAGLWASEAAAPRGDTLPEHAMWLESLDLGTIEQGWGKPQAGRSVDGNPLKLHGTTYAHGLGTHAASEMTIQLKGAATRFSAMVGVDDEVGRSGSVGFEIWVDGKKVADSGVLRGGSRAEAALGRSRGGQAVDPAGERRRRRHAVRPCRLGRRGAGAGGRRRGEAGGAGPAARPRPEIAREHSPQPAIHGPRITGSTPGRPFLFLVPATGQAPLRFSAENLPEGLSLDATTGIISGSLKQAGTTVVELTRERTPWARPSGS